MNGPISVTGKTDTTLTVSWPDSIGDFDSYRVTIWPGGDSQTILRSQTSLKHTFDQGLTPGATFNVTLELLKGGEPKGTELTTSATLSKYPSFLLYCKRGIFRSVEIFTQNDTGAKINMCKYIYLFCA